MNIFADVFLISSNQLPMISTLVWAFIFFAKRDNNLLKNC